MRNKEELKKFLIWLDGQGLLAFYVDDNNLSNNQLEQIMDDYMKYCTMHPHQKFQSKTKMNNDREMLVKLDEFIYELKIMKEKTPLRNDLMTHIKQFLTENKLDGNQHMFVDYESN